MTIPYTGSGRAAAPPRTARLHDHHQGQGATEFLLAAVPVLLMGLGAIEAAHWYFARQAVSLALAQAARAAITRHADPAAIDLAFSEALLPLHAGASPAQSRARLRRAMERRTLATGLPAWRIHILSPSPDAFHDFASSASELSHLGPRPVIDNDYLREQHQARLAQGWPEGRGPLSGRNTLEANTLALRLTWLHEPLLPGVKHLARRLAPAGTGYGVQAMARGGYLPIRREVAMVMQSAPVLLDTPAHGRVVRREDAVGDAARQACMGLWCLESLEPGGAPQPPAPGGPGAGPGGSASGAGPEAPALPRAPGIIAPWPGALPETGGYRETEPEDGGAGDPALAGEPDDCPGCCA